MDLSMPVHMETESGHTAEWRARASLVGEPRSRRAQVHGIGLTTEAQLRIVLEGGGCTAYASNLTFLTTAPVAGGAGKGGGRGCRQAQGRPQLVLASPVVPNDHS